MSLRNETYRGERPRRLIRDVQKVSKIHVILIGGFAGLLTLLAESCARSLQWTSLNLESLFASCFFGTLAAPLASVGAWIGVAIFLTLSSVCASAYAFIFWSAHRSGSAIGMNLALFHWAIAGVVVGLLPTHAHTGLFMLSLGLPTAAIFFALHLVYGATVGVLFDWAALRSEYPVAI